MRLVDSDQPDVEPGQRLKHPRGHEPLRRQIEQARLARRNTAPCGDIGIAVERGIDRIGRHAGKAQCGDLVLHQRHQRRNDNGEPAKDQRRDLVAERFASAGRHHSQHMTPGQQCLRHSILAGTKIVEAEHILQDTPLGILRPDARRRYLHQGISTIGAA